MSLTATSSNRSLAILLHLKRRTSSKRNALKTTTWNTTHLTLVTATAEELHKHKDLHCEQAARWKKTSHRPRCSQSHLASLHCSNIPFQRERERQTQRGGEREREEDVFMIRLGTISHEYVNFTRRCMLAMTAKMQLIQMAWLINSQKHLFYLLYFTYLLV